MSSNAVLIGLVTLTLGATAYVAVSVSSAPSEADTHAAGTPETETDRAVSEEATLLAIAELRTEIAQLEQQIDLRFSALEGRFASASSIAIGGEWGAAARDQETQALAAAVAENVQGQLDAKLERLASRQRNRNMGGEWKAPIDELAEELGLSEVQTDTAIEIFDEARDEVFDLLKASREDGGSLLDDLVTSLRNGDPNPFPDWVGRIFTDKIPGKEKSYLAEMIAMSSDVKNNLSQHFSEEQMQKFGTLNVAVLEVETGYDPVAAYVEAGTQ